MKIKKLQILDFQGINGRYEYEFTDTINALCLSNGSGKTSFMNALRYAITGIKPAKEPIRRGSGTMAVGLTFHDGVGIIRQDYNDKSARYFVNQRPVTKTVLDDYIQKRAGVSQDTMKIATSSEVLAALKPKEFGSLLLSYIPERLTKERIKEMAASPEKPLTDEEIAEIDSFFPDSDFDTDEIRAFYKKLTDTRKVIKRNISEAEGFLNHFGDVPEKMETEEELQKMLSDLQDRQKGSVLYKEQMKLYEQKVREREELIKRKEAINKEIDLIKAELRNAENINVTEEMKKELDKSLAEKQKILDESNKVYSALSVTVENLEKALKNLDKPVCPLSEKLHCTTDKTPLRDEWNKALEEGREGMKTQYDVAKKAYEEKQEILAKIEKYNSDLLILNRQKSLMERLDSLIRNSRFQIPDMPEEPKKYEGKDYSEEINKVLNRISLVKNLEKINKTRSECEVLRKKLDYIAELITLFDEKGRVMDKIAEYYMEAFEQQCNLKAEALKPGMKLKFIASNGVTVLTDIRGDGEYVEFGSLSGGEKAYVLFVLLDMLNALTGLRMLMLDELSVLDGNAFRELVKLLKDNEDDYDFIVIASAEHDDNIRTLDEFGIKKISFDAAEG
jgi:Chromosome segregation ATPases